MMIRLVNILSLFFRSKHSYFTKLTLLLGGIHLKKNTIINRNFKVYGRGKLNIGQGCWIGVSNSFFIPHSSNITIGDNSDIGPDVKFYCGTHEIGDELRRAGKDIEKSIFIGAGAWVGASSIILPGAYIGEGSIVAAGSVVVGRNYPENVLLAGNPAKIIKNL